METRTILALGLVVATACSAVTDSEPDGEFSSFSENKADGNFCVESGSIEARAIMALANDIEVSEREYDRPRLTAADVEAGGWQEGAGLDSRAARNLIDDRPYKTIRDLDDVPYVGPKACRDLLSYACEVKGLCVPEPMGHYAQVLGEQEAGVLTLSFYQGRSDYTATLQTGECVGCTETLSGSYTFEDPILSLYAADGGVLEEFHVTEVTGDSLRFANGTTLGNVTCDENTDLGCFVPPRWRSLVDATASPTFSALSQFLREERDRIDRQNEQDGFESSSILPRGRDVFSALEKVTPDQVRVVLIGQDPYPTRGHANGLCFSVNPGVETPASLKVMYEEMESDLGQTIPEHGNLSHWAEQGMLMLNTVLTVREGEANSHRDQGWEEFTREIFRSMTDPEHPRVFLTFGGQAAREAGVVLDGVEYVDVSPEGMWTLVSDNGDQKIAEDAFTLNDLTAAQKRLIRGHIVLVRSAHPAPPFSSQHFLGSRPFSRVNAALALTCDNVCEQQGQQATPDECAACRFDWAP